jgi:hypothetical protein
VESTSVGHNKDGWYGWEEKVVAAGEKTTLNQVVDEDRNWRESRCYVVGLW